MDHLACAPGPFPGREVPQAQATPVNITGASVVRVFMSQGETVSLAPTTASGLPVKFSLTNGSAMYNFVPLPGAASAGWKSGTSLVCMSSSRPGIGRGKSVPVLVR